MVLTYLHVPASYDRLARILQTERHGTVFSNLRYLETLGVYVQLRTGDLSDLYEALDLGLPLIASVETEFLQSYWKFETSHAVVVVGIDEQYVYLNDPAFAHAPQIVVHAEFEAAWIEQETLYAMVGLERF